MEIFIPSNDFSIIIFRLFFFLLAFFYYYFSFQENFQRVFFLHFCFVVVKFEFFCFLSLFFFPRFLSVSFHTQFLSAYQDMRSERQSGNTDDVASKPSGPSVCYLNLTHQ
uniref:Uncharacterized protein n=1 Tax=Cacopsylla melanoneura TaxID=428564 RepID=A0A8D8SQ15_9HEMI